MRYSPEALTAFVETVAAGSFSAAARRLRKSQSTVSTSIANLEADLGFELFDRSARQPVLTAQGEQVLGYVQAILAASTRLDELAVSLNGHGRRISQPAQVLNHAECLRSGGFNGGQELCIFRYSIANGCGHMTPLVRRVNRKYAVARFRQIPTDAAVVAQSHSLAASATASAHL